MLWLTGYEASWYPPRLPLGCVLRADADELLFMDWSRHVDYVRLNALYDDLVTFEYGEAAAVAARELGRRGWLDGTIALEWAAPSPVAAELRGLEQALRARRRRGASAATGWSTARGCSSRRPSWSGSAARARSPTTPSARSRRGCAPA